MEVDQLLRESQQQTDALKKRVNVKRTEDYVIDEGNLLGVDPRPIDANKFKGEAGSADLKATARENVQLLFNALWKLPSETEDEGRFATLPAPTTRLPREKPVPADRVKTKWERFAELKGIRKEKKSRMVWDELTGEWRPRWGYKRAGDKSALPWLEVPENADPYEDQYEKLRQEKKERVKKNEENRLRNIATARLKAKGVPVKRHLVKKELEKSIAIGRSSTASAGVFDKDLPGEGKLKKKGKRTQRDRVVGGEADERAKQLDILSKVVGK